MSRSTARKDFVVTVDREQQVMRAVKALHAADFAEREKAVHTLVRQPELALPALNQARAGASADSDWWIDAAIQEIERAKRKPPKPPGE